MFADLPSDLEEMGTTLGPPPSWFSTFYSSPDVYTGQAPGYYSQGFYGLGDREEEIEVNPVEQLQELKYKQEMLKRIPKVAARYTTINPLSPMFRTNRPKFGYGSWETLNKNKVLMIAVLVGLFWFFKIKK